MAGTGATNGKRVRDGFPYPSHQAARFSHSQQVAVAKLYATGRRFKDHLFGVNRNIYYIFGVLTSRAINWYINESILRGSKGGWGPGGSGDLGGVSKITGPLSRNINIF